jgi:hypothetical protein
MTHGKCRVDRPFPYHLIRCWVSTSPPPPAVWALGRLFKPSFWRLTPSTLKRCHMDLWSAWLILTHHHHHQLHPSLLYQHPEFRVSVLSFFICGAFLWQAALCRFLSSKELLSSSSFWVSMPWEQPFYSAHWPPVWLPRLLSHWSGSRTVPWPLVLRLLASA